MRNSRSVSADNTPVVISSPHSIYLMHDNTSTTLTDSGTSGNQMFGDLAATTGTTAGYWTSPGSFTAAGDNDVQKNDASHQAFGDMTDSTQGVAQLLFFCDYYATTKPTSTQDYLLMFGRTDNKLNFTIETTGRFQIQKDDTAETPQSANTGTYGDVNDSTRHALVGFLDYVNGTLSTYCDGVLQGSTTILTTNPITTDARGFCFFANMTSDAARNNYLGGEGSQRINRMGIVRPAADLSSKIGDIAQGLYDVQHELPRVLHGI